MNVLVTRHAGTTRLGSVGTFLSACGATVNVLELHRGDAFPGDVSGFDGLIVMGGRMHAFDDDEHAFLATEAEFIRNVADADVPVLGICLGAQLLARALGADVVAGGAPEEGWIDVRLTEEGRHDPLFAGLPETFVACANHGDMLEVPAEATLLAGSSTCPHQVIRYRNAYGLQVHVETDADVLEGWIAWKPHWAALAEEFAGRREGVIGRAHRIYSNLLRLTGKSFNVTE